MRPARSRVSQEATFALARQLDSGQTATWMAKSSPFGFCGVTIVICANTEPFCDVVGMVSVKVAPLTLRTGKSGRY